MKSFLAVISAASVLSIVSAFDGQVCPPTPAPGVYAGPDLDDKGMVKLAEMDPTYQRVMRPHQDPDFKGGCAKGEDFQFLVRKGLVTDKFFIEFQGGGACWDAFTCSNDRLAGSFLDTNFLTDPLQPVFDCTSFATGAYFGNALSQAFGFGGLTDPTAVDNPVKDWTTIYVPYCTKDLHLGTNTAETDYGFQHYGKHNVDAVMAWIKDQPEFAKPDKVMVTGCSAGAVAAGYYGAEISDYYAYNSKDTEVIVLADSLFLLVTDDFLTNRMINWGWGAACGALKLLQAAGDEYPQNDAQLGRAMWEGVGDRIRKNGNGFLALVSSIDDAVQDAFFGLFGGNAAETGLRINQRASGVSDTSFIYAGNLHCANALGVSLGLAGGSLLPERDDLKVWLTEMFSVGEDGNYGSKLPAHYLCPECTSEKVTGCDGVVGSGFLTNNCGSCLSPEENARATCTTEYPRWYNPSVGVSPSCMSEEVTLPFNVDGTFDEAAYKAGRPYDGNFDINGSANMISITGPIAALCIFIGAFAAF